jgi:hypothetical protein
MTLIVLPFAVVILSTTMTFPEQVGRHNYSYESPQIAPACFSAATPSAPRPSHSP